MDTFDTLKPASIAASAPPLAADDPRLTPEAIEYRRANGIAERDQYGRLLPGSQLQGKGRKGGPMVTIAGTALHGGCGQFAWKDDRG
jgi:hypothetical protein